jgi:mannose-1-phosphate guanylyltransferase/mannose-6-phosphate isomerase
MVIGPISPVILSGGAGTRLWPVSRRLRPKQFLNIHGNTTLFAETLGRVTGPAFSSPIVICNDQHRFLVAEELRAAGITPADIILEPIARNTAPAIAAAALKLLRRDPEALMLVLPSDHVVEPAKAFADCVLGASSLAADGHLVTFGVEPTHAETGYGYIQQGEVLDGNGWQVARFVEKPDPESAQAYLADGRYFWNAGIFLFSARSYIDELQRHQLNVAAAVGAAVETGTEDLDFFRLDEDAFARAPAISIDCAVMEKTDRAAVVPLTASWSDVGSWDSLAAQGDKDPAGNVVEGEALIVDSRNTYVRSASTT